MTDGTYLDALGLAGVDEGAIAVRHGGETCELGWSVIADCEIEPLTLRDDEGRRVYERSLIFLLQMAVKTSCPTRRFRWSIPCRKALYFIKGHKIPFKLRHIKNRSLYARNC
jgi:hypothetical protein